jgi:hypothetical protein
MPEPTNHEYEYRKQRYESYIKDRDALRKDSLEVSGRYDRAILALAGGALALSITFLEKIAPHPAAWTFLVLGAAWITLIASVLLELYALALTQTVTNEQIRVGDEEYRLYLLSLPEHPQLPAPLKPPQTLEAMERRRASTRSCNDWSRWLLTIGVLLLCGFSLCNLPMNDKDAGQALHESKGSYIAPSSALPPPPPPAAPQVAPAQSAPTPSAAPALSAPAAPVAVPTP